MVDIPVTERLRRVALVIWATIGALLLVAAGLWIASQIRIIWLPLVFAGGLVVLLDPIVRALHRLAIPRAIGALFAYLILAAALVAIGFLVVPAIQEQASDFGARLPALYDGVVEWLQETGDRLGIDLGPVWTSETIREWIQDTDNQAAIQDMLGGFGSGAGRLLRGVVEVLAVTVLAPVLGFYILVDLPRTRRMVMDLTPLRLRDELRHVTNQVGHALGGFVRGQLLVAFIVGVLSSLGLRLLELPFWLIIGLTAGVLNLVPFIGPLVGGILAAAVALVEGDMTKALLAIAIFTAIQQVDNHLITPMVQRTRVRLSPLVIVLALLAGGSVAGMLGVLVAVPVVSVVRIVFGHLWRTRVLGESWAEASEAMIEVREPPDRLRSRRRREDQQERLFDTTEIQAVQEQSVETPGGEPVTTPPGGGRTGGE